MEQNDLLTLNLSNEDKKDLLAFCKLNDLELSDVIFRSFKQGYYIEKHGLLGKWDDVLEKIGGVEEKGGKRGYC